MLISQVKWLKRCKFLQDLHHQVSISSSAYDIDETVQNDRQKGELMRHLTEFVYFLIGNRHTGAQNTTGNNELDYLLHSIRQVINSLDENRAASLIYRQQMLRPIKAAILQDLQSLQTPVNCRDSPVLICDGHWFKITGGLGWRMTFATFCCAAAAASKRRLVLVPASKFFSGTFFVHVNDFCSNQSLTWDASSNWPLKEPRPVEILIFTNIWNAQHSWNFKQFNQELPPHIPLRYDPKRRLSFVLENPALWYMGILSQRIMTPKEGLKGIINERARQFGIPIPRDKSSKNLTAGIHVRTKIEPDDAPCPNVSIYLQVVEEWFKQMDMKFGRRFQRRVFIATEDFNVPREAKRLYPHYTILFNESLINNTATNSSDVFDHNYGKFDNDSGVTDIISDIILLVNVDFFVGTWSSNVGRVMCQLRMVEDPFWGERTTVSLDMEWHHYFFSHRVTYKAIDKCLGQAELGELSFNVGDEIEQVDSADIYKVWKTMKRSYLPDGTMYGRILGGDGKYKVGTFPRFKVKMDISKLLT